MNKDNYYSNNSSPRKAALSEFVLYESMGIAVSMITGVLNNQVMNEDYTQAYSTDGEYSSSALTSTLNNGVNAMNRESEFSVARKFTSKIMEKISCCCRSSNNEEEERDKVFKNIENLIFKKLDAEYEKAGPNSMELAKEIMNTYLCEIKKIIAENKIELVSIMGEESEKQNYKAIHNSESNKNLNMSLMSTNNHHIAY